eukprot:126608_1
MAEMYETLQTQTKQGKYVTYILCAACVLLVALSIFTVYYVIANPSDNDKSVTLCTTAACVSLANEIMNSINESVDPCEDFYHYSCDGWIARHSWQLTDNPKYTQFKSAEDILKQNFLDELFWYKNEKLTAPDSVQKAITYYDTCYKSTTSKDEIQGSMLLKEFVSMVNFSIPGQNWNNPIVSKGFQKAIAYLNQRDWNSLFSVDVYYKNDLSIQQNSDFWKGKKGKASYNNDTFCNIVTTTYVPLYMDIFNMNESDAHDTADDVCFFAEILSEIGIYPSNYLNPSSKYSTYFTSINFTNFNNIVPDVDPLNLTNIIYETFESKNVSEVYFFGSPDINYLGNLSDILSSTDPTIVQMFLFTNVLWYYLDFESSWEQTAKISRSDFCYQWTVEQFPFVFGYITGNTLYSDDKFDAVVDLVSSVQNDGILQLIEDSDWLDTQSTRKAVKKAATMGLFVGYPDSVFTIDGINIFYQDVETMDTNSWLINVQKMNNWYADQTIKSFVNNAFPILDEWPIIFSQKDSYKYWLTGVNAFYYPGPPVDGANFFTIPTTITQQPFFNLNFPSAVNFGGLGSVCGHEMSHGFDPTGFQFDFNGTNVGSILSDDDTMEYYDRIQCYIDQYNAIPVTKNADRLDNGTQTQTENVADNVGLQASYLAWKTYKNTIRENSALPGVDLNEKQLFFWSWAHVWCDVNRPDVFDNYTNVHSPHYARVIGSLQNNNEFKDAFKCKDTSYMSNEDKCELW